MQMAQDSAQHKTATEVAMIRKVTIQQKMLKCYGLSFMTQKNKEPEERNWISTERASISLKVCWLPPSWKEKGKEQNISPEDKASIWLSTFLFTSLL